MRGVGVTMGRGALLAGTLLLAGCGTTARDTGFTFAGLFSREPAPAAVAQASLPYAGYCPAVTVLEGGAALQQRSSQIVLGQLARECSEGPDGSTIVKIGAEGRVIMGTAGGGARFDVPVRFVVSDGSTVYASRVRRASVTVLPGEPNAFFAVVEEGIVVPASANVRGFDIEVGLGEGPRGRRG